MEAALDRFEGEPVVEVDVGDERHGRLRDDLRYGGGGGLVGHGDPHDLAAELRQLVNLADGAGDIGGVGVRHRLDANGGVAADLHVADLHGLRGATAHCQWLIHWGVAPILSVMTLVVCIVPHGLALVRGGAIR